MGQFSEQVVSLISRAAAEQAGIISGDNPTKWSSSDPLRLWVIQVGIIIVFTQLLSILLARLRQPRVIAEVIGGVLLGPSVFGRIPNFTNRIFSSQSIPTLTLTANVGLVFFLFLVGMEIDTGSMKHNAKSAVLISTVGLVIPLGLGAALGVPLYHNFIDSSVNYGYFILFVAVAVGITAFPVLCRILIETRLINTPVGVTVLSAGVGNDIVGWILLALAVALANASTGLVALYVLLVGVGYVILMLFPIKWAMHWLARKTGSLEGGAPSALMMTVTFLLVLCSAFFTDVIGIHAIFGGFVAGLVIPHEGGFAIALTEKLEDFISLIFLPLYFTLSGLNTNLGLLNTGKTWAYVVLICVVAFFAKFLGCGITARATGFSVRESGAIGTLMACKGLVELIVLNVGLSAGILNTRVFSMFVLHAIILTFITTPLTLLWYPEHLRKHLHGTTPRSGPGEGIADNPAKTNFAVVLNRVEHLPAIMTLAQLLQQPFASSANGSTTDGVDEKAVMRAQDHKTHLNALRLVELSERTSALLRSQESASLAAGDALLSVVRTSGRMHRIPVSSSLAVIPANEFAQRVSTFVGETGAHMVVIPWNLSNQSPSNPLGIEQQGLSITSPLPVSITGSFEGFFPLGAAVGSGSVVYSTFLRKVFADSPADVALFIDRASESSSDLASHHIFLPFFGGPDDRLALDLLVQLCSNPLVHGTVVRINRSEGESTAVEHPPQAYDPTNAHPEITRLDTVGQEKAAALANFTIASGTPGADTVYGAHNTTTRMQSETLDDLAWARYASPSDSSSLALPHSARDALKRITFTEVSSSTPLRTALSRAAALTSTSTSSRKTGTGASLDSNSNVIVVVGRGRKLAREEHRNELKTVLLASGHGPRDSGAAGGEMSRTVGDVGTAFLLSAEGRAAGSVLVVQAAKADLPSV